jgi:hypothetical protein
MGRVTWSETWALAVVSMLAGACIWYGTDRLSERLA